MKASELVKYIKKAVREEVNLAIAENIRPLLKHIIKEQKSLKESKSSNNSLEMVDALSTNGVEPKSKTKSKKFVKDPVLNSILNETANAEWKTMGGGTHTSNMAQAMGMQSMEQAFGGKPSVQQMVPQDRQGREIPEHVSSALTKDYSALLKAVDEKKKNR